VTGQEDRAALDGQRWRPSPHLSLHKIPTFGWTGRPARCSVGTPPIGVALEGGTILIATSSTTGVRKAPPLTRLFRWLRMDSNDSPCARIGLLLTLTLTLTALAIPRASAQSADVQDNVQGDVQSPLATYADIHDFNTSTLTSPGNPGILAQGRTAICTALRRLVGRSGWRRFRITRRRVYRDLQLRRHRTWKISEGRTRVVLTEFLRHDEPGRHVQLRNGFQDHFCGSSDQAA